MCDLGVMATSCVARMLFCSLALAVWGRSCENQAGLGSDMVLGGRGEGEAWWEQAEGGRRPWYGERAILVGAGILGSPLPEVQP